jgi:ComF family protein
LRNVSVASASALLDLLLPPSCAACDEPVSAPGQLCARCFSSLNFVTPPACRSCGLPFPADGQAVCATCAADPPPWNEARAALMYDAQSRRLILPLKYADRTELAGVLALHMQRAGAALLARADVLVPVPLHRWRLWRRRYNQSALLARALARRSHVACLPDALVRVRHTQALAGMGADARAATVGGTITVRRGREAMLAGKRVVLIDDVLTSGATARACTRALLDAGVANIDVLVASRVADPRSPDDGDVGDDIEQD